MPEKSKYETLSVAQLRAIVKQQGIKNTSTMRKAQLVELVSSLHLDEEDGQTQAAPVNKNAGDAPGNAGETAMHKNEEEAPAPENDAETRTLKGAGEAPARETMTGIRTQEGRDAGVRTREYASHGGYGEAPVRSEGQGERHQTRRVRTTRYGTGTGRDRSAARGGENTGRERAVRRGSDNAVRERTQHGDSAVRERTQRGDSAVREHMQRGDSAVHEHMQRGDSAVRDRQAGGRMRRQPAAVEETVSFGQTQEVPSSDLVADGILEVLPDGFGFIRSANYLPGDEDVYVSHAQIRRFNMKTGDIVHGTMRIRNEHEKFNALLRVEKINGFAPEEAQKRMNFENMTPIFSNKKLNLETPGAPVSMRMMNLVAPIGRGQRGMIVSPPKTGKTTLIKQVAQAIHTNYPDLNIIILLIDERPEEVTDIKEFIEGDRVEVIYSTFDELPEHHKRVAEMVLERAKRLVEHKQDVVILLDSITRLARAYNMTVTPSGRTLTGGLDPAALHMPKRFFGAARNMREGGSLTVLATALVDTGSKMDDVVFEEFKGTGNMELVLDRKLSEQRVFPAIDIAKSGTRREDLLLTREELDAMYKIRKSLRGTKSEEATETVLKMFQYTKTNEEFVNMVLKTRAL